MTVHRSIAQAVGRNTIASLVARAASLLVWFALTPMMLSRLGADRFGFWAILLALGGSLATVDLGLGVALSRFVAESVGRGDPKGARTIIVRALGLQLALTLICAVAGTLGREFLLDLLRVPAAWRAEGGAALVVALFGFALSVPGNLFIAALQGLQRMDLYALVMVPLAFALAISVHIGLRSPQPLFGVVVSQVGYNLLVTLVVGFVLHRALASPGLLARPVPENAAPAPTSLRRMLGFGAWVQLNGLLGFAQTNLDKFLIASFVSLTPVAAYELGVRITGVALLAPMLALSALLPAMAHRAVVDGTDRRLAFYRRASYPYLVAVAALIAALVGLAPPLLEAWLGRAAADQVFVLRALAVASGLSAATGIASTIVRAGDRLVLETQYGITSVVLHAGLSLLGIALLGWIGAIYGLVVSSFLAAIVFVFRVESWLGVSPLREIWIAARAPAAAFATSVAVSTLLIAWLPAGAPGRAHGFLALGVAGAGLAVTFAGTLVLASPRRWRELLSPFTLAGGAR